MDPPLCEPRGAQVSATGRPTPSIWPAEHAAHTSCSRPSAAHDDVARPTSSCDMVTGQQSGSGVRASTTLSLQALVPLRGARLPPRHVFGRRCDGSIRESVTASASDDVGLFHYVTPRHRRCDAVGLPQQRAEASADVPVLSSDSSDSSSDAEPEPEVCHLLVLEDMWDNIARRLTHPQACAVMCTCTQLFAHVSMSMVACSPPSAPQQWMGERSRLHEHMDMLEALARAAYRGLTIGHEARAVAIVGSQLAPDRRHMHRLAANVVIWCMSPPQRVFSQERKESQARVCAATRVCGCLTRQHSS